MKHLPDCISGDKVTTEQIENSKTTLLSQTSIKKENIDKIVKSIISNNPDLIRKVMAIHESHRNIENDVKISGLELEYQRRLNGKLKPSYYNMLYSM